MTQGHPPPAGSTQGGSPTQERPDGSTSSVAAAGRSQPTAAEGADAPIRRLRLNLSRVDPWSVMKLSFLLSIGIGIAIVVATVVIWNVVDAMGLFTAIEELANQLTTGGEPFSFLAFFEFRNMLSISVVIAVLDIVLLTALGTLGAFLYNIVAALLGGLNVTFTDE